MIEFQKLSLSQKAVYEEQLFFEAPRGCEYSFANLYLWGRQCVAAVHGCFGFFSHFYGRSVYPFPIGSGDKKAVIVHYLEDAKKRGIPCRITGVTEADRLRMESWFPGQFRFRNDRNGADYVYAIDDLADLRGRKYQKKRNHVNKFHTTHPDCQALPLTPALIPQAQAMVEAWYARREETDPAGDYMLEKRAISRAFRHFEQLGMEGLVLMEQGEILAMTMGSRLSPDTFDIHFEKAREDVDGAYAAINCEFARYLRLRHPELKFLDREEDMGLEGLRKSKLSYLPHHMTEKYWAYLTEDLNED